MKNFIWFVVVVLAFSTYSCQEEEEKVEQNTADSFTKSNAIASLIMRVSQNETSADNVLDNTSLFSVKLPVGITVDGHDEYVTSTIDFLEIQGIKDEHSYDDDVVTFTNWPITVSFPDYQTTTVENLAQLNAIKSQMGSDDSYHEISCIDFVFPFNINKYNTNNQVANTKVVHNDTELYNFINDLQSNEIVGIVYPLTLKKQNDGTTFIINSNTELEAKIIETVNTCSTNTGTLELANVLTNNGPWRISYCYYDNQVTTDYYNGYVFVFTGDGGSNSPLSAVKGVNYITGTWHLHDPNTADEKLDLGFEGDVLQDLESGWNIYHLESTYVELIREGSDNEHYFLTFTKN
jgi:hypothetical protein